MFWGEYSHCIDKKGRLIIPARYRAYLCDGAFLTRGLDKNLVIYPQESWKQLTEQISELPLTNARGRSLRRLFFSGAVDISLDRQGRLLIPAYLREYASLEGDAFIIGMETYIEIWEPSRWHHALDEVSSELADSANPVNLSLS